MRSGDRSTASNGPRDRPAANPGTATARTPLRILVMNWRCPKHPQAGGAEAYLFEMARRWVAAGHSVLWLTAGFPGSTPRDSIDGVTIRRVGGRASVYAFIPLYYLLRVRGRRFDAIVDSENGIPFFSPLYSRVPQLCVIYHVHRRVFEAHLPFPISKIFVWLELRAMPYVYRRARFVTISETTRDEMARYRISARAVPIVYVGVSADLVPAAKSPRPTILYLGRLKEYKRIDVLISALPLILARVPAAKLVIAGDGDQRAPLTRLAAELGVSQHVEFAGYIDEPTKARLLAEAWVFANASSMEGWGISVIEANACGTPSVVADSPGLSVAVTDGVTGLVASPETMGERIATLLEDRPQRERLAGNALARSNAFSWDHSAAAMLDLIYEEIERRGARSAITL